MAYVVPVEDVDGNYINPDWLSYRVFVDGEQWKFEKYFYKEFVDEWLVNARFSDRGSSMNRTDFSGSYHVLSFPKELRPTTLGLQSVYKVGDEEMWSDIITYTLATKEKTIEEVTGIKSMQNAESKMQQNVYNIFGQKVGANAKGIVIVNGKKYLKK